MRETSYQRAQREQRKRFFCEYDKVNRRSDSAYALRRAAIVAGVRNLEGHQWVMEREMHRMRRHSRIWLLLVLCLYGLLVWEILK